MVLPPGFQFDPTDEELIVYFLYRRASNLPCYPNLIPDLHLSPANPWDLNENAFGSEKGWYFFSEARRNRCCGKGFWKEIGLSEAIFTSNGDDEEEVGIKKYLVFYGDEEAATNWVMEEYHLLNNGFTKIAHNINQIQEDMSSEWVLCRVHEEDSEEKMNSNVDGIELSYLDEVFFSMEDADQEEISFPS